MPEIHWKKLSLTRIPFAKPPLLACPTIAVDAHWKLFRSILTWRLLFMFTSGLALVALGNVPWMSQSMMESPKLLVPIDMSINVPLNAALVYCRKRFLIEV